MSTLGIQIQALAWVLEQDEFTRADLARQFHLHEHTANRWVDELVRANYAKVVSGPRAPGQRGGVHQVIVPLKRLVDREPAPSPSEAPRTVISPRYSALTGL